MGYTFKPTRFGPLSEEIALTNLLARATSKGKRRSNRQSQEKDLTEWPHIRDALKKKSFNFNLLLIHRQNNKVPYHSSLKGIEYKDVLLLRTKKVNQP